jgi:hypothetical protein
MSTQVISTVSKPMATPLLVVSWTCRIAGALILLQTLFFKFTAAPESVYIFTKVGAEPWGRIWSGIVELIAAILSLDLTKEKKCDSDRRIDALQIAFPTVSK